MMPKIDWSKMAEIKHTERELGIRNHPFKNFDKSRGFTTADIHRAAEELRMEEGLHSQDPMYHHTKKNR